MPKLVEELKEFFERQACDYVAGDFEIGPHNYARGWLFENGAFANEYQRVEPPTSELGQATMQRQYWHKKEKQLTNEFNSVRDAAARAAKFDGVNVPSIGEHHIEEMERLQKEVFAIRDKIKGFDITLAKSPVSLAHKQKQDERQANLAYRADLVDRAKRIEI